MTAEVAAARAAVADSQQRLATLQQAQDTASLARQQHRAALSQQLEHGAAQLADSHSGVQSEADSALQAATAAHADEAERLRVEQEVSVRSTHVLL